VDSLDVLASRAIAKARLLERAVHDPGPWWVQVGDCRYVASRLLLADQGVVSFVSWIQVLDEDQVLALTCGDEAVSWRPVPGVGEFTVTWDVVAHDGALSA
jgi:hypothetical protein